VQPKKPAAIPKAKKTAIFKPKLLSPTQAAQKLGRQDLLFGTSSQLRKEDSPEQLKQLQLVLHESNTYAALAQDTFHYSNCGTGRAVPPNRGGLWQEAAGTDKDTCAFPAISAETLPTLERIVEQSPFTDIPTGLDVQATKTLRKTMVERLTGYEFTSNDESATAPKFDGSRTRSGLPLNEESGVEWASIDDFTPVATREGANDALSFKTSSTAGGFVAATADHKPLSDVSEIPVLACLGGTPCRDVYPQSVTTNRTVLRALSTNTKKLISITTDRPSRKSTIEQLATMKNIETAKIPRKKPSAVEQGPLPEKKPRGRPRVVKHPEAAPTLTITPSKAKLADETEGPWHHIDDIEDSDLDLTPSPPRRRGRPPNDRASQLPELVITETVNKRLNTFMASATHPDWAVIQPSLFKEITDTVKATPPSTDIHKPSWAEKIALYDPIVIEDLTAWLNGDMQLKVRIKQREDELQGWMVQKWCEEKSVCCLWREGMWGGVKKKY
jgi:hypothetical protein